MVCCCAFAVVFVCVSLHVLVWLMLLCLCDVLWLVFALCFVVVECVLLCIMCLCVSFVVYCETLYMLFVCALRVCGLFYAFVCDLWLTV